MSANQQWIRSVTALPLPTIKTPVTNPYISNSVNLLLAGGCQTGLVVTLAGVSPADVITPAESLTTLCANSNYSFTVAKPDGSYTLTITQTDGVIVSGGVSLTWKKDTVAPVTTLSSKPAITNYSTTAEFVFRVSETATSLCSLNGSSFNTCTSPLSYDSMTNGSHTLTIKSVDVAGNSESSPVSYTWTQAGYKTLALYHFDSLAPMLDSSLYTGGNNSSLINTGTTNQDTGKFLQARFINGSTTYASTANNPAHSAINSYLTLEAWVKIQSISNNASAPLISKMDTSGKSFEFGIRKQGGSGKYLIYFRGSLDGTSFVEPKPVLLSSEDVSNLTTKFNHVAVTWSLGTVKYYFNGVLKGSATVGAVGSAKLANSAAKIYIGNGSAGSLTGTIDEARISQVVRWNSGFTPPSSANTAD